MFCQIYHYSDYCVKSYVDNNFLKKTMNSSYDLVEEDFIHETSLTISPVTCCKKVCRVLPTPVCRNNLLRMRHERTCMDRSKQAEYGIYT